MRLCHRLLPEPEELRPGFQRIMRYAVLLWSLPYGLYCSLHDLLKPLMGVYWYVIVATLWYPVLGAYKLLLWFGALKYLYLPHHRSILWSGVTVLVTTPLTYVLTEFLKTSRVPLPTAWSEVCRTY